MAIVIVSECVEPAKESELTRIPTMTTKEQANKCTTHHPACACLEYKREQLEKALRKIKDLAAYLPTSDPIRVGISIYNICDEVLDDE